MPAGLRSRFRPIGIAVRPKRSWGTCGPWAGVRTEAYSAALALVTERACMVPLYIAPTYYVAGSELSFGPSADGRPRFYEMAWR
jgi:hypothetical protein